MKLSPRVAALVGGGGTAGEGLRWERGGGERGGARKAEQTEGVAKEPFLDRHNVILVIEWWGWEGYKNGSTGLIFRLCFLRANPRTGPNRF